MTFPILKIGTVGPRNYPYSKSKIEPASVHEQTTWSSPSQSSTSFQIVCLIPFTHLSLTPADSSVFQQSKESLLVPHGSLDVAQVLAIPSIPCPSSPVLLVYFLLKTVDLAFSLHHSSCLSSLSLLLRSEFNVTSQYISFPRDLSIAVCFWLVP